MKRLLVLFLLIALYAKAQTGIGTTTPNASAKLDVYSTNKGFLPPRVSLNDIYDQTTIPSPATGLLVYCKGDAGLTSGYYYWNGNAWATIATAGGSGSFASSYLRGSRTATQSVAVNGAVTFTSIDNSAGSDISLNTSTGKITLAPGNTYRLRGAVPNFSGGQRPAFIWYNETTSSNIGSASHTYNTGDAAAYGAFGVPAEVIITPNVTTIVYFKLLSSLSSGSVTVGGNGDFSTTGSYPWFDAEVISGNSPTTGQSVDYVSVSRTATDQTVNTNSVVLFNTNHGGNIPYNTSTGLFSLTAGKTYKLTGVVSLSNGNTVAKEVNIVWKNAAGDVLGTKGEMLSPNAAVEAAGGGTAFAIYTPTVNTTVSLVVNYSSSNTLLWHSFTFASIEQIGSSAIINPWVLSGNDVYNTTGEVGIGNSSPNAKLDVRTSPTSTSDPGAGTIGLGTSAATAASSGSGALRYNASTSKVEVSNGTVWQGASAPIFAQFLANTAQNSISATTKINFQTTVVNVGGISIASNNSITLPAGRIYRVDFNAGWVSMAGGWARFAIYNNGTIASIPAHLESVNNSSAINSSGATTTFINTSGGSTTIDVRYVAPSGSTVSLGDTGNGTSYPYIVIQAVD